MYTKPEDMYVVLACGSRTWENERAIFDVLYEYKKQYGDKLFVVHGNHHEGADAIIEQLCHGPLLIDRACFIPNWLGRGKAAGPNRNEFMVYLMRPKEILAFRAEGKSAGTDDVIKLGKKYDVPTNVFTEGNES